MNGIEIGGIIQKLARKRQRMVLAESCTGGLIAARLTSIPGASDVVCGSMVTYRDATKQEWLGVPAELIGEFSSVSEEVTLAMARAALSGTAEASLAVAVTGHLGPGSPRQKDGHLFIAAVCRDHETNSARRLIEDKHLLRSADREARQVAAAEFVLRRIEQILDTADLPLSRA